MQLNEYSFDSDLIAFDTFEQGYELYKAQGYEQEPVDQDVRRFAEECDQVQGFQMFSGVSDGWSGFASGYIEDLHDEYPKAEVWSWAIERSVPSGRQKQLANTLAFVRHLVSSLTHATLHIPLFVPETIPDFLSVDKSSKWHTSALLSAAMESFTLPTRGREELIPMYNISEAFRSNSERKIGRLRMSLPGFSADLMDFSWVKHARHTFHEVSCLRAPNPQPLLYLQPDCVMETRYPLLDSFPPIFRERETAVSVFAQLSAEAGVRDRLHDAREVVRSVLREEERSELMETLQMEYEKWSGGWESDQDEGSDD